MKQVLIIGTLGFVGYSLCCRLLEDDITVFGLDYKPCEGTIEEEKLLEIGRNSNFTFIPITDELFQERKLENIQEDFVFYSLPRNRRDSNITRHKEIENLLEIATQKSLLNNSKLIIFKSLAVGEDRVLETQLLSSFEEKLTNNKYKNLDYMIIKLPTLYGPWQPFELVYQQLITAKISGKDEPIEIQEDTNDVLFIDDAIDGILSLLSQPNEREIQIKSGLELQWYEGIKEISPKIYEKLLASIDFLDNTDREENYIEISPKTSISKGIEKQYKHTEKLKKRLF